MIQYKVLYDQERNLLIMKKLIAVVLVCMLVLLAFASCDDKDGDGAVGDVSIPGRETEAPVASESGSETERPSYSTDSNGEVNLPIDWFTK